MSKIITITSGKGGAGKSTVSVGLSLAFCDLNKKVLVIDVDCGLRSLDIMTGISQAVYDLEDVLEEECALCDAVYKSPLRDNLFVLSAPFNHDYLIDGEKFEGMIKTCCNDYDIIIIDTPAGLGNSVKVAAKVSELIIFVTTPDPVCIRDICKTAMALSSVSNASNRLVINRSRKRPPKYKEIKNYDDIIDVTGLCLIGIVKDDSEIAYSLSIGEKPKNKLLSSQCFENIARRILGERVYLDESFI